ncbi:MAG TPA: proteasome assembly chaperone family protein [Nitrososphaerales archaeon]|nr:proteasome assembly chaperone family protein [Nitrososphaerales archaeon]
MPPKEAARPGGIVENVLEEVKAPNPVLVCGLPGSGYVGKLAADHLVGSFKAKKVAEYTCDSFPPQVNVKEDGTAEPIKAQVFYAPVGKERSLLVFTADAQPTTSEGEYELSDAVIGYAKRNGVTEVYTLAAYITGSFAAEPKVYGAATSKRMLDAVSSKGATLMKGGGISGMNGLMIGMAALRGLEGVCLLGETSGYLVDAAASKSILEVLSKLVGFPIDTEKLKEKAEETQKVISQLQGMSEEAREAASQPRRETRPGYIS